MSTTSVRASSTWASSGWRSGWHAGPTPWRCTGSVIQADGSVLTCGHPDHAKPAAVPVALVPADADDAVIDAHVLLTPTAYELSTAEPETEEWFDQRRGGITGTDLPKILGVSGWGNALSVWLDKRGELPWEEAGEPARWGNILEEPIAREYSARTGQVVHRVGTLAHAGEPWMRASLDRLVADQDGFIVGALEIKTRSGYVSGQWRDGVPDDVLAQVVWQLMVTGLAWCDVAVLLGGQRLQIHRVTLADEGLSEVADLCRREAEQVWGHVLAGAPPAVDADETLLRLLEQRYPDRTGVKELTPVDTVNARVLIGAYEEGRALEKDAKRITTEAKAGLVQLLDDACTAVDDTGQELFAYPVTTRAGYTVEPTTYRTLKINRRNL